MLYSKQTENKEILIKAMDRLKSTSQYLSYLLWHKPDELNLEMDKNGYVEIAELLSKLKGAYKLTNAELLQIVTEDSKNRYKIKESKIRAQQGHSIKVDLEMDKMIPPLDLFHGTDYKFYKSINEKGLIPKGRNYVHLSDSIETAKTVGSRHGKNLLIYKLNVKEMIADHVKFYQSEKNVWLTEKVDSKYLEEYYG